MKRALAILLAITMVFSLNGCGNPPSESEAPGSEEIRTSETEVPKTSPDPAQNSSEENGEQNPRGVPLVVSNIAGWNHPIKNVLEGFGFFIVMIELYQERTYPVITVDSVEIGYNEATHGEYVAFLTEAARINGYWDYAVYNRTMGQRFEVTCNQENKRVTGITVNGIAVDMNVPAKSDEKDLHPADALVMEYLMEQVPEIVEFNSRVQEYNQSNKTSGKPIMRIDSTPDSNGVTPYEKDYYAVYIGESLDNHTNRWATFLVRKDLKEILADDPLTGQYITLPLWREAQVH